MSHILNSVMTKNVWAGAFFMVMAGVAFAIANALTQIVTSQMGFKPQSDAFWQYLIALILSLPFLWRHGAAGLKTKHPVVHLIRVVLSAFGVQAFVVSLSQGVPLWQVIALVMTSPFFVMIGAWLFLGENVGVQRWLAAVVGFAGAMIILQPSGFTTASLLPVAAAVLWGAASLLTKFLTADEPSTSITVWLLLLLSPINAAISYHAGFEIPSGNILWLLLAGGIVILAAQYFLTRSYAAADAAFVQPFDDIKLISNVVVGGLVFHYWPEGHLWLGVAMILAASSFLLWTESGKKTLAAV